MENAKKGLRILSLSIILNVAVTVAFVLIAGFTPTSESEAFATFITRYLPIILLAVTFICYILDFVGLNYAGKSNRRFKSAWRFKMFTLLLTLVGIILAIVAAVNPDTNEKIKTVNLVLDIIVAVSEFIIILAVIKGCLEIAPRVKGLSKFVSGLHIFELILFISIETVMYVMERKGIAPTSDHALAITASVLAITFSLALIAFAVLYVLLIFRTTINIGKSRK